MDDFFGASIFGKWHFDFPFSSIPLEGRALVGKRPEPRLDQLLARFPVTGCRVLDLGCMEGWHAMCLCANGAAEVLGVEGRRESFLKCLVAKNALGLDRCKFLYADVQKLLPRLTGHYHLCLALGILYHLEDPAAAVYRIGEVADSVFCWTHYVPSGELADQCREITCRGKVYRGVYKDEDTGHYLSGLDPRAFWLYEPDLMALLRDAGFTRVEVISRETAAHGPAITFLAQRPREEGIADER